MKTDSFSAATASTVPPKVTIKVQNYSLSIDDQPILNKINFNLYHQSVTTIIGPSGSGKTSFLNSLNRLIDLIPDTQNSGSITYDGQSILAPNIDFIALRRRVGMIFQKPNPFAMSIWKNLALPLREHGMKDKAQVAYTIERGLQRVGLWQEVKARLHKSALTLSGGQQQRLCIARALVLDPEILLMDEPCSALDPISSAIIEELILGLKSKCSVLVVTHNLAQAKRIGDYTALFGVTNGCGTLVEFGRTSRIFSHPQAPFTSTYIKDECLFT